jgi:two-component sensor histidine kinase
MLRCLFVFLAIMAAGCSSFAQNTSGELVVHNEKIQDTSPYIRQINLSERDTTQVNLLIKIVRIYWYQRRANKLAVDSCLLYAKQAYQLSKTIRYTEGINEAIFLLCKAHLEQENFQEALSLSKETYGQELVRLLIIIAEPYIFHYEATDREFNKALPLIAQALQVSSTTQSVQWMAESYGLYAKFHFKKGMIKEGREDYLQAIKLYHDTKDYNNEALYWSRLGSYLPATRSSYQYKILSHEMAVKYYKLAGNKKQAGYSLRDLATVNGNFNHLNEARKNLAEMKATFDGIHETYSITTYNLLADFHRFAGEYDQALYYAFEGLKAAGKNLGEKIIMYKVLAATYALLNDYRQARFYHYAVLEYQLNRQSAELPLTAYRIATFEADIGHPHKALLFLNNFLKKHPATSINDKQLFASTYGNIYDRLGKYNLAEQQYLKMIGYEKVMEQENAKVLGIKITLMGSGANFLIGKFYTGRERYKEGKQYLEKSLENPEYFDAKQELETYQLMFKADSALSNYNSAIRYYERYHQKYDSINSARRAHQVAELGIKYQTAQKAQNIRILRNKEKLQQAAIQRSETLRNVYFGGSVLLSLLALTAFMGFRNKQRSNLQLQIQQDKINTQNLELQLLLSEKDTFLNDKDELLEEKDSLLKEKDWLLKEVHHRVKNNLQIIMSLLRTQQAHLKTEDAKAAIMESENRVQAIALIHHKLFHNDKVASIAIRSYIADLVNYLGDGLNNRNRKILFHQLVDDIYIDLAQAVPLGLILNEAITNSIKYGERDNKVEISIQFKILQGNSALLEIKDNGKGLPAEIDLATSKSLGMQMMKGLSRQLKGTFEIDNGAGLTVSVQFNLIPVLSDHTAYLAEV